MTERRPVTNKVETRRSTKLIMNMVALGHILVANPAWADTTTNLWGVWKGSTGDAEVLLCVQADPDRSRYDDFAAIYTTADYQIELLDRSDETGQTWGARRDETVTASLSVLADGSVRLERDPGGAWSGVPLALIPFSSGEDQTRPCESAAFNLPRAVLPTLERTADSIDDILYEIFTLVDPAGHGEVSTFQLPPGPEGHDVINAWLELCPKVDGAVKSRFILGAGPSIFGHDYIARQKDR